MQKMFVATLSAICFLAAAASAEPTPQKLEPAVLPTEALPASVGAAGEFWLKGMRLRAPIVAEQPIRFASAIVRTDIPTTLVMPMIIIGKVAAGSGLPANPANKAWCDVSPPSRRFTCFQDLDGDGKLETERFAGSLNINEPLTIAAVAPAHPVAAPIPYRIASDTERVPYRLVYESCPGGSMDEPRFIQRVRSAGGGSTDYGCTGLATRLTGDPKGNGTFRVDRLTVEASEKLNSADTKLIAGIAPGTLLDRIMPAEPVYDLGTRPSLEEEALAEAKKYAKIPFQLVEAPEIKTGEVPLDTVIATGRLAWGYTARLKKTVTITNMTSSRSIEAGEQLYGVPMTGGTGMLQPTAGTLRNIVWCAPRRAEKKWEAACMPDIAGTSYTILLGQQPAFLVSQMFFPGDIIRALGTPEVEEGPVNFGEPVAMEYRLTRCIAGEATLIVESKSAGLPAGTRRYWIKQGRDRKVRFELGGGVIEIEKSTNGCLVHLRAPMKSGGTAIPHNTEGGGQVRLAGY